MSTPPAHSRFSVTLIKNWRSPENKKAGGLIAQLIPLIHQLNFRSSDIAYSRQQSNKIVQGQIRGAEPLTPKN